MANKMTYSELEKATEVLMGVLKEQTNENEMLRGRIHSLEKAEAQGVRDASITKRDKVIADLQKQVEHLNSNSSSDQVKIDGLKGKIQELEKSVQLFKDGMMAAEARADEAERKARDEPIDHTQYCRACQEQCTDAKALLNQLDLYQGDSPVLQGIRMELARTSGACEYGKKFQLKNTVERYGNARGVCPQ